MGSDKLLAHWMPTSKDFGFEGDLSRDDHKAAFVNLEMKGKASRFILTRVDSDFCVKDCFTIRDARTLNYLYEHANLDFSTHQAAFHPKVTNRSNLFYMNLAEQKQNQIYEIVGVMSGNRLEELAAGADFSKAEFTSGSGFEGSDPESKQFRVHPLSEDSKCSTS
jgi:hypothetical protein